MHALSVSNLAQNRWRRLRPIMLRVGNDGVLAFLLSGTALICYVSTLAPGVLGGDAGELQFVPYIFSLTHPTGYPLQTLLNRLWITIVPVGSVAWRINLLSALVAALGVSLTFVIVRRATGHRLSGLVAAGALAIAPVYWGQAVLSDKYALNGLLTALWLWRAWRFYEQPGARSWVALALVTALGLAHHRTFLAFGLPLAFLVVTRGWRLIRQVPVLLAGGAALLAPLLLYLYVPLAAARGLPPYHTKIKNWAQFVGFMRDAGFVDQIGWLPRGDNFQFYITTFLANFGLPVALIAASGLVAWGLWKPQQRGWMAFLLSGFVLQAYLTQNYDVPRRFVFFVPAYVCAAALVGAGIAGWLELVQFLTGRFSGRIPGIALWCVAIALVTLPLSRLPGQWRVQWAEQHVAQPLDIWRQNLKSGGQADRLSAALKLVQPRALVVGDWEQATPLWYAQQVEGVCPDCLIQSGTPDLIRHTARASAEGRPLYVARTLNQAADWSEPTAVGPLVHLARVPATEPPDDLVPLGIAFDGRVQLVGYTWPLGRPTPRRGTVLPLSLVWRLDSQTTPDYAIALRLVGPRGEVWRGDTPAPVLGMHPFSRLQTGQVIADYYEIPIPPDAPVGRYALAVVLYQVLTAGGFANATVTDSTGHVLDEFAPVLTFDLSLD